MLATFAVVYEHFGPTFPGIYDEERSLFTIFYLVCIFFFYSCMLNLYPATWISHRSVSRRKGKTLGIFELTTLLPNQNSCYC